MEMPARVAAEDTVFLVEVYAPSTRRAPEESALRADDEGAVIGSIDIPVDELTLLLVAARDAAAAERVVRLRGQRPIRIVPARYSHAAGTGVSGISPMLPGDGPRMVAEGDGPEGLERKRGGVEHEEGER